MQHTAITPSKNEHAAREQQYKTATLTANNTTLSCNAKKQQATTKNTEEPRHTYTQTDGST